MQNGWIVLISGLKYGIHSEQLISNCREYRTFYVKHQCNILTCTILQHSQVQMYTLAPFPHPAGRALISDWLPTAREDNVFTGVCHSVHHRASWLLSHCSSLLWHGRYASYFKDFLFVNSFIMVFYQRIILKFSQNLLSKLRLNFFSHRQPLWNYSRISLKWVLFL